jgi:glycosyltransferase involved in cell wall biosynthesis
MISVVTPTLRRPNEVAGLLQNLCEQTVLPAEIILVDGAPESDKQTEEVAQSLSYSLPFLCRHIRHSPGTAVQRNAGIDLARGLLIAFIDDDVRLEPDFFRACVNVLARDAAAGGVVGYRTNQYFRLGSHQRWRWYRRLKLLTTFEPGRYDFETGYPINANMQPPFSGVREVDFMTTACAVWRREVFESGLRFDPFFSDYGVLEDAHFSLRAGREWKLFQCGDARCIELHSANSRVNQRKLGYKYVVNYYYVFRSVAGPLSLRQQARFWRYQAFELFRIATSAIRRRRGGEIGELLGRLEGAFSVARGTAFRRAD